MAQDASLPTGTACRRSRPPKWRTRGRLSLALCVAVAVLYPTSSPLFRLRYRHGERIPGAGPVLLVVYHVSVLDPLACARLVWDSGRVVHFLARASAFRGPAGRLLRGAGQIPVARFSADAHQALRAVEADLAAGNVVVIYPEGSVTRDPVHDYHTKRLHLRLRSPVDYLVGDPVDLTDQRRRLRAGGPVPGDLLRETTELIMGRVRGQLAELRGEPAPLAVHPRPPRELPGDVAGSAA